VSKDLDRHLPLSLSELADPLGVLLHLRLFQSVSGDCHVVPFFGIVFRPKQRLPLGLFFASGGFELHTIRQ